jgi:hypothetical protein
MKRQLQPEEMRLYRLCDEALFYVWDPISVGQTPEARDEYEAYAFRTFELVQAGARDEAIAYLTDIQVDRMGLRLDEEGAARAVDFMLRGRAWVESSPYLVSEIDRQQTKGGS